MARHAAQVALLALLALAGAACAPKESRGCPSGQVLCGGLCRDPASYQTDANDCGGCGIACGAGATCSGGLCQCAPGTSRCDALDPRCRDLQTDPGACGSCTTSCSATKPGSICQTGACQCGGTSPDDCGTFCTNTQTDARNCAGAGGCGHPCLLTNEICSGGTCECPTSLPTQCPAGTPTACVNTTNDPSNCGSCGNACSLTNEICSSSVCQCPASLPTTCGSACVNLATDPNHCGNCTTICPSTATCASGSCACPPGGIVCNNACIPCAGGTCISGACHCASGPASGCSGQCCDGGTSCCTSGCPLKHSNGLGQFYFDCSPLATTGSQTTLLMATEAANAWMPGTTADPGFVCDPYCVGRVAASPSPQCAVWCWGISNFAGHVGLNTMSSVCLCPTVASPTWN